MSTTLQARIGRERQRYEDRFRLVAGCIPYRLKLKAEKNRTGDFFNELEVLMISSPNRHDLVFPKGGWENDETVEEAACREALEEAGVRGIINETILGVWEFRSKSRQNSCSQEGSCRGYMFALEVTEQLEYWPEQSTHDRRWVSVREAWLLCRYDWMREALSSFLMLQSSKHPLPLPEISEPSLLFCFLKPSEAERVDSAINVVLMMVLHWLWLSLRAEKSLKRDQLESVCSRHCSSGAGEQAEVLIQCPPVNRCVHHSNGHSCFCT